MPQLAENSVQVMDGKIVLTKRPNSPRWQARYKVGKKWIRLSTGHTDIKDAEAIATRKYYESTIRFENDQPVVSRKFKSIAEAVIVSLEKKKETGEWKKVYKDYIEAIRKWLIPFFGNHNIASIDVVLLQEFSEYRTKEHGKELSPSTINTHTTAMNVVFDEAVRQGYVNALQVPKFKQKKNGNKISRRPDFDLQEYHQLARFMQHWVKRGRKGKSSQMRYLLRDYVFILANSGIRHGTEAMNLRWSQIEISKKGVIAFNVYGKTKERRVVTRYPWTRKYLERIVERSESIDGDKLEDAIKTDGFVIALPDGSQTNHLGKKFDAMLAEAGLTICPRSQKKRVLYSMRHFYITTQLRFGRMSTYDIHKNCGTSLHMIEKYYDHVLTEDMEDKYSR